MGNYVAWVSKQQIRQLINAKLNEDGLVETGVKGVQLFRVTEPVRCAPAVYEPTLVAIVSGTKEAILDGTTAARSPQAWLQFVSRFVILKAWPKQSLSDSTKRPSVPCRRSNRPD